LEEARSTRRGRNGATGPAPGHKGEQDDFQLNPKSQRVIVEERKMIKRHTREEPGKSPKADIVETGRPTTVHISQFNEGPNS